MHPRMQPVVLEIPVGDEQKMQQFQEAMDALHDAHIREINKIAKRFNISKGAAADVAYLRTRSRWTQAKENHLISLAQQGKQLPNVLAGEF